MVPCPLPLTKRSTGLDLTAGLKLLGTALSLYAVLLWLASVLWAYRDIRARTVDPISQAIGVALVALLPLLGIAIYLIVRPGETLIDAYERELEQEALRSELHAISPCPNCRRPIEPDFVVCAYCRTQVREECMRCRRLLSLDWHHCPYCGTSRPPRYEPVRAAARQDSPESEAADAAGRTRERGAGAGSVPQPPRRAARDD